MWIEVKRYYTGQENDKERIENFNSVCIRLLQTLNSSTCPINVDPQYHIIAMVQDYDDKDLGYIHVRYRSE